jgi:Family of unknown function (DUF5694)
MPRSLNPLLVTRLAASLALSLFAGLAAAQTPAPPAEVLIFGTFHFANPGHDLVKTAQIDVTTPDSQAYLAELAQRLCAFKPTRILLEYDPSRQAEQQRRLDEHLAGHAPLRVNENEQIGFRVAKACGVAQVRGFDENQVHWNAGPLMAHMKTSAPELKAGFDALIAEVQAAEAAAHRSLDLRALLLRANDPALDRFNKDLYLFTNAAGAGSSFVGADATASWWHRNFRMYAHVQQHAQPGERVLVLAGQGHTAILRDLLAIDRRLKAADIRRYL